jgi:hypothetical protein
MTGAGNRFSCAPAARAAATALIALAAATSGGRAGAAELTGRLLGADGNPAPDMKVSLYEYDKGASTSVKIRGALGSAPSFGREYSMNTKAVTQSTDAAGRFRFAAKSGLYVLIAPPRRTAANLLFVEELLPVPIALTGPFAEKLDLGDLRYEARGAYVSGTVRLDGRLVRGAHVRVRGPGGALSELAATDENGPYSQYLYVVPPKGTKLTVTAAVPAQAAAAVPAAAPQPWSSRLVHIDLTSARHGTVVGVTRRTKVVK